MAARDFKNWSTDGLLDVEKTVDWFYDNFESEELQSSTFLWWAGNLVIHREVLDVVRTWQKTECPGLLPSNKAPPKGPETNYIVLAKTH